ncbi:MAG: response regulator [Rhizobiales bacterium]|nr:response regulator [Hyphomicrobiales bacterium]
MRLLIVDDSRLDRTRIKRLINQMNADVSLAEAQDVPTALGMVAVERFDCILLDYRLPGADGVDLAAQIAASHGGAGTPMVMLTGEPSEDLAEHAIGAGLTDFLGKRNLSADICARRSSMPWSNTRMTQHRERRRQPERKARPRAGRTCRSTSAWRLPRPWMCWSALDCSIRIADRLRRWCRHSPSFAMRRPRC